MSFILDALKKSESERQQQAGGDFANVPSSSGDEQSFRWLWILGLLLLVNLAVLLGILTRDRDEPPVVEPAPPPVEASVSAPATAEPSFEQQVAAAREKQPAPAEQAVAPAPTPQPVDTAAPATIVTPAAAATSGRYVPTFDELRVNGTLQLGDLHLDIHVYADDPAERFVFINMNKQRENSRLEEGPFVREITPDGVILEHQGSTFLLPRE